MSNQISIYEAWSDLLGSDNVIREQSLLETAQTATFITHEQIPLIVRPGTVDEVQKCLKLANKLKVPIYPISSGKNWGYGSRVPTQDGCVLLDLSRLNQILDYNETLAYVTIEPGVTQRQLYEFLQAENSSLWMDATGSSPDTSIIGNTMERGFGHTPYGDRFAHVCGLEVILPNGDCIHTGFGQYNNSQSASIYRWGVGPYLDGLFSQSNLGIITKMTMWLMPKPEYFQAFYFSSKKPEQLPHLIDGLRPLRLNDTIKSAVHLANDYKVISSIRQYPWEESEGVTPLPAKVMTHFAKTWDFGAWNGSGGLYGTKAQVAEARRLIKEALRGKVARLRFVDDCTLQLAQTFAKPYQTLTGLNLAELLKLMKPVYGLMQGIPTPTQLASTYWRKKKTPPTEIDPDHDQCGLIWFAPVAPLEGKHASIINDIATQTLISHGFEPLISMTLLTGRCLSCIIAIAYDREVEGEDQKAMACYESLVDKILNQGYHPYRLGIQSMGILSQGETNYQNLLTQLKTALDPNHILAPRNYIP